jgi:hypothetical protein
MHAQKAAQEAQDAFQAYTGCPMPDDPHVAIRRLRRAMERELEHMLSILDAMDADPDLEDEPDAELTWPETHGSGAHNIYGIGELPDDSEDGGDAECLDEDREEDDPSEDNTDAEDDRSDWEWSGDEHEPTWVPSHGYSVGPVGITREDAAIAARRKEEAAR